MKKNATILKKSMTEEKQGTPKPVQIVAIGASAGGLEAITELVEHLTPDTGMVFIYIQHLSPDHKSVLPTLLSKSTKMKVQEVTDKILMIPDHLYIIPPDKDMTVLNGHIQLTPRTRERVVHLPIDTFFSSLAETHREDAIGVVLSGSASDGTKGLMAIKAAGGLTFAQNESAKFNSMPKSAIAAGAVDLVLSPKEIALELIRISKYDPVKREIIKASEDEIENTDPDLKIILNLLLKQTGADFSHYKMATIKRRMLRRMLLNKIKTVKEYALFAKEKKEEINILYQDLLINVTEFFRDADTHQYLKTTLFPHILKTKAGNEKFRIWIPACATGEEAYSIAMIIMEIQEANGSNIPVQIFATDLSAQAIARARIGEYDNNEIKMVSPKRLQRFYTKSGSKYRIAKLVRDMCVFAPHNILGDPPFSRVDFISCCNLFIYLDNTAQKKALNTFHYALNEGGYLMLGKSETIGTSGQLFTQVHKKYKIHSRRNDTGFPAQMLIPKTRPVMTENRNNASPPLKKLATNNISFDNVVDAILLSKYVPASVVINHSMEILQFRGNTNAFLRHPAGKASLNILKMSAPELAFELRHCIPIAIKSNEAVRKSGIEVKSLPNLKVITLEVIPLAAEWEEPLLLILFTKPELVETFLQEGKTGKANGLAKDRKIQKLEEELSASKADMHAFTEEQEAFVEELQSANEEVVSSNEELQSVNEELETSKEEIESTNEELTTTNQELQTRNELLNESYQYSDAILANLHEPLLVLDKDLRVMSASKSFYKKFRFTPEETEGMLLYDVGNKEWDIPALRQLLEDILPKNAEFQDFEVTHNFPRLGEKIMLLNASRIVQKVHHKQLILLSIADITEVRKKALEFITKEKDLLASQNQVLEEAVEKRTNELKNANDALEENNLALKIWNKELESFSYIASHDLQEPLRKIKAFANRIMEGESALPDKTRDYINKIQIAAQRMQALIEDLLSFSSVHNIKGKKQVKTDLNVIIEEVRNDLNEIIEAKHATVTVGNLCDVIIIPYQFRQVLLNLIGNALKFSVPGRPPVITINSSHVKNGKIKIADLPPLKEYCHIIITDNGIGFEDEFKEKIFDIFQRLHDKDDFPGTGIGLAIVKKIVENHNGIITAKGELGKGATFEIYIPTYEN